MTGKENGTKVKVFFALFAYVLVCFVLLYFGGCAEGQGQSRGSDETTIMQKDDEEAYLLAELDRKFENPDIHCKLGRLYHARKQWAKAEYHYNVSLGFDPAHRATQAAMVKMLIDRNGPADSAKAQHLADNYINQVSASARESLRLAQAFEKEGLDKYAFDCYQQALRVGPDLPEVNKQVGIYYLYKGDKEKAKQYLSRSFELNPNQPDVANELGRLGVVVSAGGESR